MTVPVCAVLLAAGEGRRLRPLTALRPKPLCPVGNVALIDRALARLARHGLAGPARVAANACHLADQVEAHVGNRAHVQVEPGAPLGTAGGLANLRDWIAGRGVLVGNADAYLAAGGGPSGAAPGLDLEPLLRDWDGERVRILTVPADPGHPAEFNGTARFAGFCLLPWSTVERLRVDRPDLVREAWRPAEAAGRLELIGYDGTYIDSGTIADYLRANLHAAGAQSLVAVDATVTGTVTRSVVGRGAKVHGEITRCVVWPGAEVGAGERLTDAVRVGRELTVPAEL